jgi:hypothetical protein
MRRMYLVAAGWVGFACASPAQTGGTGAHPAPELRMRVLEGEKAEFRTGTKTARPLLVEVTDETGRPVAGVVVSFRLPETGPSGVFANGLRTDIAVTAADGRAAPGGVRWGDEPGVVEVRVTAARGAGRAGLIVEQVLSAGSPESSPARAAHSPRDIVLPPFKPRRSWVKVAVVAGVAAAGAAAGLGLVRKSQAADAASATPELSVGTPSVTIGGPR